MSAVWPEQSDRSHFLHAINLRLALIGQPTIDGDVPELEPLVGPIIARQRELSRQLAETYCGADQRIQDFLDAYTADCDVHPQLPHQTLVLDEVGMAKELSLPWNGDEFSSELVNSYRLANGVLHNPANDRRTTAGVFHIAEGGLPIPDDKLAVPREVFARLAEKAFAAPHDGMILPYTSGMARPAATFVSMYLRPLVSTTVPGFLLGKSMETRFIVPGGLVSNLDFIEEIFGNAGDPYLLDNDAALDPQFWTGTTGLVVLAPHLKGLTKRELGLPMWDAATQRQRRDGMCWKDPSELYNGGSAFKICARDESGVIVTIIADNYFGYCKKEIKTQISYSANLFGLAEEEHSGGAITYPAWNLTRTWTDTFTDSEMTVDMVVARDPEIWDVDPAGYARLREHPHVILVPAGSTWSVGSRDVAWIRPEGGASSIPLRLGTYYLTPCGYRVHLKARDADPTQWHLIGTAPNATQLHKPATVSGGGKSEISKSILDAFVFEYADVPDFDSDIDAVAELLDHDYSDRFADPTKSDDRAILERDRSLGSVVKLFTPGPIYTPEYNAWIESIPSHVTELLFVVKRYYKQHWGKDWRSHFSVSHTNGHQGSDLYLDGDKVIVNMLRVGFEPDGGWRLFSLRPDFSPAMKVQTEDDITVSVVAPEPDPTEPSRKYVENCERMLFQRPDDAIIRGYDKQAERDMAGEGNFFSNFQQLTREEVEELADDAPAMSKFTPPMRERIERFVAETGPTAPRYLVVSSEPRIVDGKRTKNPRYLQLRPDLANPVPATVASIATHLWNKIPLTQAVRRPVDVVVAGRRNNAAEDGVPPLCAYNPLHYMELPELLMEFISSMTGKSPSTTGAGSEGALTKGPFNALPAVFDLNAALLSYALTETDGWLSSAGVIGPKVRVDHDISLLIPELFSRMTPAERDAHSLISQGLLERLTDFEVNGRVVQASRLGYRITSEFVANYFGRIFQHPQVVFTDEMLAPELQDVATYAESIDVIVETHRRVAQAYIDDGTIAMAVPPLRALLQIMATGESQEGWTLSSEEFRAQFTRQHILDSTWYHERLLAKQAFDIERFADGICRVSALLDPAQGVSSSQRAMLAGRLQDVQSMQDIVSSSAYLTTLHGSLGREPRFEA